MQTRVQRRNFRRELIALCNAERRRHGLGQLRQAKPLRVSATAKARDMAKFGYFSHDTPHGTWYRFLYKYAGNNWRTIGENIARDQDTAEQVFEDWMDSPVHRANILAAKYKLIGIGFARKGSREFWVQHFGTLGR